MSLTAEDKAWIAERIDGTNARLDATNARLDSNNERLDGSNKRLDATGARLDASIERLTGYVLDFRTETIRRLDLIENRLEVLAGAMHSMDTRFPLMAKAIDDFGLFASQLARQQSLSTDAAFTLAQRVARLEEQVARLMNPAA